MSAATGGQNMNFIMILVIFVAFYLLIILPQMKRAKKQRQLIAGVQVGDEIITGASVYARVVKLEDDLMTVCIAPNIEIMIQRGSVLSVIPKGTLKW